MSDYSQFIKELLYYQDINFLYYYPIYLTSKLIKRFILPALYFTTRMIVLDKELLNITNLLAGSMGFKIGICPTALTKYN